MSGSCTPPAPTHAVSRWERRPGEMAVYKSSRARPNKSQYGWGNLPPELIQTILSLVVSQNTPDPALQHLSPLQSQIACLVSLRIWLSELRLVSAGWSTAVNTHPFWATYLQVFGPETEDAFHQLDTSTAHFQVTRAQTIGVCILCKMSTFGSRIHRGSEHRIHTSKLGILSTCDWHQNSFCTGCLRDAHDMAYTEGPSEDGLMLLPLDQQGSDEQGQPTSPGMWCRYCRDSAISVVMRKELAECARGGVIRGLQAPWGACNAYREHVYLGIGLAEVMGKRAVEEMALFQHTRWRELEAHFRLLQYELTKFRAICFYGRVAVEIRNQRDMVRRILDAIWPDEWADDYVDVENIHRGIYREIQSGEYTEDDCSRDMDRIRRGTGDMRLEEWLRDRLTSRCIDFWASDRVRNGFWIMPSDEVDQILNPSRLIHNSILHLAPYMRYPFAEVRGLDVQESLFRFSGCLDANPEQVFILPPQKLLLTMNDRFVSTLTSRLELPLRELTSHLRDLYDDDEAAESACEGVELSGLLKQFVNPSVWIKGGLRAQAEAMERRHSRDREPADQSDGGSTMVSDDSDSRRAEALQKIPEDSSLIDEDLIGVTGTWTEHEERMKADENASAGLSDTNSPLHDSAPSPGACDMASETAESHRRESSEGSTTTALVTPGESPNLFADSIQLAAIVDADGVVATADSALGVSEVHSVPLSGNAPGAHASPTLGKRKSPDDDDREGPRARRRNSSSDHENDYHVGGEGEDTDASMPAGDRGSEPSVPDADGDFDASSFTNSEAGMGSSAPSELPSLSPSSPKESSNGLECHDDHPQDEAPRCRTSPRVMSMTNHPNVNNCEYPPQTPLADSQSSSMLSEDDSSEASSCDTSIDDVPFVPPAEARLGPGASSIIMSTWYTIREPLRECRCSICERAATESEVNSMFLAALGVDNAALRID